MHDDEDIFIKIDVTNRFSEAANITVLPTLFFYNRWQYSPDMAKPTVSLMNRNAVVASHYRLADHYLYFLNANDRLFTENETNTEIVTGIPNETIFTKQRNHPETGEPYQGTAGKRMREDWSP